MSLQENHLDPEHRDQGWERGDTRENLSKFVVIYTQQPKASSEPGRACLARAAHRARRGKRFPLRDLVFILHLVTKVISLTYCALLFIPTQPRIAHDRTSDKQKKPAIFSLRSS